MNRRFHVVFAAVLIVSLTAAAKSRADVLGKTTQGRLNLRSIDVISFAPEGVLLIGDGTGAQVFAVKTADSHTKQQLEGKIGDIRSKLAARVGTTPDGIEIMDLAVHPTSGLA